MALDLNQFLVHFAPELGGKPGDYFVDAEGRPAPLVIEHATGDPVFAIVDGALVPYDAWRAQHQRPTPAQPPAKAADLIAQPGQFQFGATVTNPADDD